MLRLLSWARSEETSQSLTSHILRIAVCPCPTLQFAIQEVCNITQSSDNFQIYLYTFRLRGVTCYSKPPKISLNADYIKVFTVNILAICCIRIISVSVNI